MPPPDRANPAGYGVHVAQPDLGADLAATTDPSDLPAGTPLSVVQAAVRKAAGEGDGCTCPACGAKAKVYERGFGSDLVVCLLWLYQATKRGTVGPVDPYASGRPAVLKARAFDKLELYGLAERDDETGDWRLTDAGRDFAEGKTKVPDFVLVYRGEKVGQAPHYSSLTTVAERSAASRFHLDQFRAGLPVGKDRLPK